MVLNLCPSAPSLSTRRILFFLVSMRILHVTHRTINLVAFMVPENIPNIDVRMRNIVIVEGRNSPAPLIWFLFWSKKNPWKKREKMPIKSCSLGAISVWGLRFTTMPSPSSHRFFYFRRWPCFASVRHCLMAFKYLKNTDNATEFFSSVTLSACHLLWRIFISRSK